MELIPHDINIDFVGKRLFFVLFSAAINLVSIGLMLTWGFNYGVDFAGGAVVEVRFPQSTTARSHRAEPGTGRAGGPHHSGPRRRWPDLPVAFQAGGRGNGSSRFDSPVGPDGLLRGRV